MKRIMRYIIGLIALAGVIFIIFSRPPEILIYPELPYLYFLKRAFFILVVCSVLSLYRIVMGPTAPDRIVAIDMFGILIVGFCAVLSIATGRGWYIDIGIAWALQSFISTLALAKYLEGRDFDE
jgi:multicomponent Na+:H+ antiporter subunit F